MFQENNKDSDPTLSVADLIASGNDNSTYFRPERQVDGLPFEWYFLTDDGEFIGPYKSEDAAVRAYQAFIAWSEAPNPESINGVVKRLTDVQVVLASLQECVEGPLAKDAVSILLKEIQACTDTLNVMRE